jgi:hypothetical protein
MNFTTERLKTKYNSKKSNATNKGIEFNLTYEEYEAMFLQSNGMCDYTGMVMSDDVTATNYVSIERLNANEGYIPSNVCLIRTDANKVKGEVLDTADKGLSNYKVSDNIMLAKVCETIYNPTKLAVIKNKYKILFDSLKVKVDNTIQSGHIIEPVYPATIKKEIIMTTTIIHVNPELILTQKYYQFGTQIESFEVGFELTYGEFKRMVGRKCCQLTNRPLTVDTATVWVMDKGLSVCKDNVLVLEREVAEALDVFVVKAGIGYSGLLTLCKNLGLKGV